MLLNKNEMLEHFSDSFSLYIYRGVASRAHVCVVSFPPTIAHLYPLHLGYDRSKDMNERNDQLTTNAVTINGIRWKEWK